MLTQAWWSKWLNFIGFLRDGANQTLARREELIGREFHLDGEQFVDDYIRGKQSMVNMAEDKRKAIILAVNASTWYLLCFLYADPTEELPLPCIMPSSEILFHIQQKERRDTDLSLHSEANSTNTVLRKQREEPKQNIVINQNHYYIQQMNVQKERNTSTTQST